MTLAMLVLALVSGEVPHNHTEPRPAYRISRATVLPIVDGAVEDEAWAGVPEMTNFIQSTPEDGAPAREQTRVKIIYAEDALYVAAVMEAPGGTRTLLTRRDSDLSDGDLFRVAFDTELSRTDAYAFLVNPSNVQRDFLVYNDTLINAAWNGVWQSATRVTAAAWYAELRIPFSQLRFPRGDAQVWGFNVSRWNVGLREFSHLAPTPQTQTGVVSRFADLTGIAGVKASRRLEILPYTASRTDLATAHPLQTGKRTTLRAGLDLKAALTSNFTVTATVNPDFGQVEADPAVVNLTAFETFLPEQRPFFTEGAPLFEIGAPTPNRWAFGFSRPLAFYSRRIGRTPQRTMHADFADTPPESTILGALKLTGRTKDGWSVGVLDAVTEREHGVFATADSISRHEVEPLTNYFVARVAKETPRARNGILVTAVHRALSPATESVFRETAYFVGVDGYRWNGAREWLWDWQLGSSRISGSPATIAAAQRSPARYFQRPDARHVELDPRRTALTGYMAQTTVARETGRFRPNMQVQILSPGLELNDLGFAPRVDNIYSHAVLSYQNTEPARWRREVRGWIGKYNAWNFGGDPVADGIASSVRVERIHYDWFQVGGGRRGRTVDDRAARGGLSILRPAELYINAAAGTDPRARVSADMAIEARRPADDGFENSASATLRWRPSSAIAISVTPRYRTGRSMTEYVTTTAGAAEPPRERSVFGTMEHRELELGIRTDWTATPALTFQLYLQPLIAAAHYHSFKELVRPRSDRYAPVPAPVDADFTRRAMRGSAVVRWEYRRGSALYIAWNEQRDETVPFGDIRFERDFRGIGAAPVRDVFLVKLTYWLPF